MSRLNPWVVSAREELQNLERRAEEGLSAMSAYRILVLLARLEQARAAGLDADISPSARSLGARLGPGTRSPAPTALLGRLEAELLGDEDPFGELLDALLQLDDAVSVSESRGEPSASELARLADAIVALAPERVGALGDMAERRLATLPPGAAIRPVWETVARSAVEAALRELPSPAAPASLTKQRLMVRLQRQRGLMVHADVTTAPIMRQLVAVAASGAREPTPPVELDEVGLYEEDGTVRIRVEIPPGRTPAGELELHVSKGERRAVLSFPLLAQVPEAVIASLGSLEALRARLRAEGLSTPDPERQVEVLLPLKERVNGA